MPIVPTPNCVFVYNTGIQVPWTLQSYITVSPITVPEKLRLDPQGD